ncbi:MAG: hypothetical protein R3C17_08485 [Planctomycetaceae bacterium]
MKRSVLYDKTDAAAESRNLLTLLANERKYLPAVERLCEIDLDILKSTSAGDEQLEQELVRGLTIILGAEPGQHLGERSSLGTYYVSKGMFGSGSTVYTNRRFSSRLMLLSGQFFVGGGLEEPRPAGRQQSHASIAADAFRERNACNPYSVQESIEGAPRAMILAEKGTGSR